MGKFEWVGRARQLKPDGLYQIVVRQPGVGAVTYGIAQQVGSVAEATLAANTDQGHSKIEVTKGTLSDAFVSLDDSGGKQAAAAIEFGHYNKRTGKHVPGVAPLRTGIASV